MRVSAKPKPLTFLFAIVAALAPAPSVAGDWAGEVSKLGSASFEDRDQAAQQLADACSRLDREGKREELRRLAEVLLAAQTQEDPELAGRTRQILAPYRAGAALSEFLPRAIPNSYVPVEWEGILLFWESHGGTVAAVSTKDGRLLWEKKQGDLPGSVNMACKAPRGFFLCGASSREPVRQAGWVHLLDPATGRVLADFSEGLPAIPQALVSTPKGTLVWGPHEKGDWICLIPETGGTFAWTAHPARPIEPSWKQSGGCLGGGPDGRWTVGYRMKDGWVRWCWSPQAFKGLVLLEAYDRRDDRDQKERMPEKVSIRAFDLGTGKPVWECATEALYGGVLEYATGPRGELVATGGKFSCGIDPADGTLLWKRPAKASTGWINSHAFSGQGFLVSESSAAEGSGVALLDCRTGRPFWEKGFPSAGQVVGTVSGDELFLETVEGNGARYLSIDPATGTERWQVAVAGACSSLVSDAGILVIAQGTEKSDLRWIDRPSGKNRWEVRGALPKGAWHVAWQAGNVLVAGTDPRSGAWISLRSGDGARERWFVEIPEWQGNPGDGIFLKRFEGALVLGEGRWQAPGGWVRVLDPPTGKTILSSCSLPGSIKGCDLGEAGMFLWGTSEDVSGRTGPAAWAGLYRLRDAWEPPPPQRVK